MGKTVQIRNVPDKVHRILKTRAAQAGMSLSAYLSRELKRVADKPSVEEVLERLRKHEPVSDISGADLVRRGRAQRDAEMREWMYNSGRR
jgi:plasmid stability protein